MKCINCGETLGNEDLFCGSCGANINDMIAANHLCGNCGALFSITEKVCPNCNKRYEPCPQCGADLVDGLEYCQACGVNIQEVRTRKARKTKIIVYLSALLCVLVVIMGIYYVNNGNSFDPNNKFHVVKYNICGEWMENPGGKYLNVADIMKNEDLEQIHILSLSGEETDENIVRYSHCRLHFLSPDASPVYWDGRDGDLAIGKKTIDVKMLDGNRSAVENLYCEIYSEEANSLFSIQLSGDNLIIESAEGVKTEYVYVGFDENRYYKMRDTYFALKLAENNESKIWKSIEGNWHSAYNTAFRNESNIQFIKSSGIYYMIGESATEYKIDFLGTNDDNSYIEFKITYFEDGNEISDLLSIDTGTKGDNKMSLVYKGFYYDYNYAN